MKPARGGGPAVPAVPAIRFRADPVGGSGRAGGRSTGIVPSLSATGQSYFHATYGGREVKVRIADLSVMAGGLNARAMGLVIEWATQHRAALRENWDRAGQRQPLEKIPGLK